MCMNCKPINTVMIRYRHLIPQLDDLLDELHEYRSLNHVLRSLLSTCVVVYFDDSTYVDDYIVYVKSVLQLLKSEFLYVNLEKCTFCTNEVVFLGFVVGSHGVKVDEEKVKVI
ncbi:Retrovirus-related Pol polyprotein from transposon 17.6, partial [Mucuna pruriens]